MHKGKSVVPVDPNSRGPDEAPYSDISKAGTGEIHRVLLMNIRDTLGDSDKTEEKF